jgi:hypothetical protein
MLDTGYWMPDKTVSSIQYPVSYFSLLLPVKLCEMIEIGKSIVSSELLTSHFTCNLEACKGACCVMGDSGAPLEEDEVEILREIYPRIKAFLSEESVATIDKVGTSVVDFENDKVTPLNNGKECAYVVFKNGIALCAIEQAYNEGVVSFRKPVSCHLYPVRIKKYKAFDAVNYDHWEICKPAIVLGDELKMPVHRFVKDALSRKYGVEWFNLLETAARNLKIEKENDSAQV